MPHAGRYSTSSSKAAAVADALSDPTPGCRVVDVARMAAEARFRRDVREGLAARPRSVPPAYLYDARGSALYEAIVELPEYYPARTEEALLRAIAPELGRLAAHAQIVELGSGSSWKTRRIIEALGGRDRPLTYVPIDVNGAMLEASGLALCNDFPRLRVRGLAGQFEDALAALAPAPDRLFVFLGGTVGNLLPDAQTDLFRALAGCMRPPGHLLLGYDRRAHASKPAATIHDAYNDAQGVTAEFDLNLLARLNRELGADFARGAWAHQAIYDPALHRIEMHLRSLARQTVTFPALGVQHTFEAGESILTEVSRKFDPDELAAWFARLGFRTVARWSDPADLFGLALFAAPVR